MIRDLDVWLWGNLNRGLSRWSWSQHLDSFEWSQSNSMPSTNVYEQQPGAMKRHIVGGAMCAPNIFTLYLIVSLPLSFFPTTHRNLQTDCYRPRQADVLNSPLVLVARTDAEAATMIDSNIDPIDHPHIKGMTVAWIWNRRMAWVERDGLDGRR